MGRMRSVTYLAAAALLTLAAAANAGPIHGQGKSQASVPSLSISTVGKQDGKQALGLLIAHAVKQLNGSAAKFAHALDLHKQTKSLKHVASIDKSHKHKTVKSKETKRIKKDPVQVPEPGSLMLLGAALVGLALVRRRRIATA